MMGGMSRSEHTAMGVVSIEKRRQCDHTVHANVFHEHSRKAYVDA